LLVPALSNVRPRLPDRFPPLNMAAKHAAPKATVVTAKEIEEFIEK
jgi:hypothetical protein